MDLGLDGRAAIVTGASRGLGRGVAEALAAEGVRLVISSREPGPLEATASDIAKRGTEVVAFAGDLTDDGVPEALCALALDRFGRLDTVVTNTGGPPTGHALDLQSEAIRAAVEMNLLAHVRLIEAALPHLLRSEWARICSIASYSVVQPLPDLALSNLARSGLRAWMKTVAHDLADTSVTLNLLAPGFHLTERMRELGVTEQRAGDPADFGRIVAFLCSKSAGFVNGATIVVDGGATLGF